MTLKNFVASAKINMFDKLMAEGRSLMYTRNSNGLSILPCGTPDNTGKHLDKQLLMDTHWVLPARYDLNQVQALPCSNTDIPKLC